MDEADLRKANANLRERERLAAEIVDLMPLPFERRVFFEDVRTWRVTGRSCIKSHENESVSIRLTGEDVAALQAIRQRKIDALVEEFESIGIEVGV